ncbi:2464_t:CDS:2 [Paraglomus brasilianum]|uniref:2464_t:CDS:1 n=1 Tax=Paraglomus brasilianum TaxID=144538 RepID=A0A9N9CIF8_9GLOM|nr:2464_t:CDS:2 [Paraglomus brasilianum]
MSQYPGPENPSQLPQQSGYVPQTGMSILHEAQPQAVARSGQRNWKAGLFDCFSVPGLCFKTFFCPCITYGETKEKMNSGSFGFNCSCFLYSMCVCFSCCLGTMARREVRGQKGIDGGCLEDSWTYLWCACCALIQERREYDD